VYCIIPKNVKAQSAINRKIIQAIESGEFLDLLYGLNPDLEHLSLWGTEPTLNMPVFIKTNFFDKLLERFPKLANFNLSTNLVRN